MDFIHMDLTGYPQTVCIHLIASSLDGRPYTLCAIWSYLLADFMGVCGCHCPWSWVNGIRYLPRSSPLTMIIGFFWYVMLTSSSLCIVTPSFVNMDKFPSSDVLPTLISEVGNYLNVSASAAFLESCGNVSEFTYTYCCRCRHWIQLLYCMIFLISVGLIWLCPVC